ncbi:hypothetical protein NPX13_g3781 [Xylaria arbuscula]|uniref:Tyrosinase copper-binding domain-containing protein n=1 Tax=Xylaria arbuscula TaxID=114810 RepID=A0A9W8TP86_9PEZI|nr:hypothetical protein NPX13_g3781 [Xylaria arbuscula]
MRYSITSQALCGAVSVSALALPNTQLQARVQHVDISNFKNFPTADPKVYFDKANGSIREYFKQGMFNDGPMDKSGKWLDRPTAILENIEDKLELQWDNLEDFFETGKIKSTHPLFKDSLKDDMKGWGKRLKKTLKHLGGKSASRDKYSLDDWADLFNFPKNTGNSLPYGSGSGNSGEDNTGNTNDNTPKDNTPQEQPTTTAIIPAATPEIINYPGSTPPGSPTGGTKETCNSDRTAFVEAIKCLQTKPSGGSQYTGSQNRYEDLVSVHRDMTANIHQTAAFLVWHRYFVWVFEQLLREECSFDRAMPWWDETKHAGAFAQSDVFTDAWFGNLPAKTSDGQGTCIESGEFGGTTLHVGPGTGNSDHCLSRAVDESQTAQCNNDFTNSCLSMSSYDDFRDCFELG